MPKLNKHDYYTLTQAYLNKVYGPALHKITTKQTKENNQKAESYGEILPYSIDRLITKIPLADNDVFIDLGSGIGKAVMQVFLQTEVTEAIGIEILAPLHEQASLVAQQTQSDLPQFYRGGRKTTFLLGSFFDITFDHATYALITSSCFGAAMMYHLNHLLDQHKNIHTVLSLRPLHTHRLRFQQAIRVECSWDSALCYVYRS